MTEAEIKAAVCDIQSFAVKRGFPAVQTNIGIADYTYNADRTVHGYIIAHGARDIDAKGATFAEVLASLRAQVDAIIPDEQRLADILGIELPQVAAR